MKAVVLGAGVIGMTSAYYLAKQAVKVTVLDRQAQAGMETSFANAGQISPGYSTPWAAPGIPFKALKWLFQKDAPLSVFPDGSLFQLEWLARMLANCTASRYETNKERMLRLASFSTECLGTLRREIGNHYQGRQAGTLQVFRHESQWTQALVDAKILDRLGVQHQLLQPQELLEYEPALAVRANRLVGGLRLVADETGDCFLFTQHLAKACADLGVTFLYGHKIHRINKQQHRLSSVTVSAVNEDERSHFDLKADHFVLALGSYSRQLGLSLGLDLPVYPLKGYSLTIPIKDSKLAPVSTVMDESYKVAVTRFDDRIRVGGMAEVAGFSHKLRDARRATLEKVVTQLFPEAGDIHAASFWTGLRPMTPDSTPIVGASSLTNLWLNTGHGTLGWTMACGSGKLLSELILGQTPSISPVGLDLQRYQVSAKKPAPSHLPKPIKPGLTAS